ncbi:MAG: DNA-directed RNA polymerase subunit L [Candidatus Nanoarchaeia archaeon]|nr:DNA-directed RNA polymerase subunit L [Candidatus Nanoarchaeia archaeon]
MELNILENQPERLKFEILGEGHTLCNALRKELWNDKSVKIAGYSIGHALVPRPVFTIEAADAKKALTEAIKRLKKENKELRDVFKKVK